MGSESGVNEVLGYADKDTTGHLVPFKFTRKSASAEDVTLKVHYCGICHSDFIIDTIAVPHSLDPYRSMLKTNGKMSLVGIPEKELSVLPVQLVMGRKMVAGSLIGGMKETKEMLEFCGENNITCLMETLPVAECNTTMERLDKNDVKYRFVLDLHSVQQ